MTTNSNKHMRLANGQKAVARGYQLVRARKQPKLFAVGSVQRYVLTCSQQYPILSYTHCTFINCGIRRHSIKGSCLRSSPFQICRPPRLKESTTLERAHEKPWTPGQCLLERDQLTHLIDILVSRFRISKLSHQSRGCAAVHPTTRLPNQYPSHAPSNVNIVWEHEQAITYISRKEKA